MSNPFANSINRAPRFRRQALVPGLAAFSLLALSLTAARPVQDSDKFAERAKRAGEILDELVKSSDSAPPESMLRQATCIAAVPGVKQAGLGVGGRVGYGLASCRLSGGWSAPTFMALKGGSIGLQIGGQSADMVLVFMNKNAAKTIASSTFNLGGQASVAAGPVGRNATAETDYKASAEIYSYSRTKGLFAGIDLAGTKWEVDTKANEKVYGALPTTTADKNGVGTLLAREGSTAPALVQPFLASLARHMPAR
ncbi:MAG TPA: lipid-binding SYLF domain-containing protein [Gemmatimonadales bacterium]|nr:lipid-binding SYLF domain-containing protein [Gemmatimonadales bacterium]